MVTFSRNLLGSESNILFMATYIPPEKSTAYQDDNGDGISNLEGFILYEVSKAVIPPGKSDASGGIWSRHTVTSTSGFSARCRRMRPISLVEFQLMKDSDFLYIITGDLNARSGSIQDYILDDNIDHLSDSNWYICDDFSVPRKSKDNVVNKFGRSVIDLCCNFNVHNVPSRQYNPPDCCW